MRVIKITVPDPDEVIPEEFVKHMLNATREVLLAFRSLIDAGLAKLDVAEDIMKARKEIKKIEIE